MGTNRKEILLDEEEKELLASAADSTGKHWKTVLRESLQLITSASVSGQAVEPQKISLRGRKAISVATEARTAVKNPSGKARAAKGKYIERVKGVRSGKPVICGTRITVSDIVLWTESGKSADWIASEIPQIKIADVHAALAFYHDNTDVINKEINESRRFAQEFRATHGIPDGLDGDKVPS